MRDYTQETGCFPFRIMKMKKSICLGGDNKIQVYIVRPCLTREKNKYMNRENQDVLYPTCSKILLTPQWLLFLTNLVKTQLVIIYRHKNYDYTVELV